MHNRYLVAYDVVDPKRLRAIYRKLCGFGEHVQYSVFVCDLSTKQRVLLSDAIGSIINAREDRVMIVDLGPVNGRGQDCINVLGVATRPKSLEASVL